MRFGESPLANLIACLVLTLFTAFMIGAGDLRATEPLGTLFVVLTAGVTLGLVFPRYVIVISAILGLAVPTAHVLARMNSWTVAGAPQSLWWTMLALFPAIVAALAGSLLHRAILLRPAVTQAARIRESGDR
ncbi:MAG: hypothetical protein U0572_05750 [Phycisphaerales bacterium]